MKKLTLSSKKSINGGLSHCTKVALGGAATGAGSAFLPGGVAGPFGAVAGGAVGALAGGAGAAVADTKCDGIKGN